MVQPRHPYMLYPNLSSRVVLALLLFLTVGGGLLIGMFNIPGEWYAALAKPSFNPPNCVFGPVWTTLYVMIAIAGWQTWKTRPKSLTMNLWWLQLVLNFLWSPTFFTLHRLDMALAIIVVLLFVLQVYTWLSLKDGNKLSAALFVPYILWVAFATLLNFSLWQLN